MTSGDPGGGVSRFCHGNVSEMCLAVRPGGPAAAFGPVRALARCARPSALAAVDWRGLA